MNTDSYVCKYIRDIVLTANMSLKEKIVVILSVFEPYLHEKVFFEEGISIKKKFDDIVTGNPRLSSEPYSLVYTYAIINVVFANTFGKTFDKNLPHRNDILHNGTISYSDEEIAKAYNVLLSYICLIDDMFARH